MRYMLMMHTPRGTGDYENSTWSPEAFAAHMAFMHRLNGELAAAGELVAVEALTAPGEARVVRVGQDGLPTVTDGPFAEAKEFLAGYWIVEVDRPERAYVIAATAAAAPGPDGEPLRMAIEVRQVMGIPSVDL